MESTEQFCIIEHLMLKGQSNEMCYTSNFFHKSNKPNGFKYFRFWLKICQAMYNIPTKHDILKFE